ncbi:MAG: DUF4445 domain-containing protein [Desulfobacteraceae bacterium]|nr:DUF4445 domain-containing protein [Desulfobacteraceae bacterium]
MSQKKIRLFPHGREIASAPERRLIESLIDNNIFLRSDCGGKGVCGKCLVNVISPEQEAGLKTACTLEVNRDMEIEIPETSMLSSHIISKAPVVLPEFFTASEPEPADTDALGIAVDMGTTTMAVYLLNLRERMILSSLSVKNPQALYGDDVMTRIGAVGNGKENLARLQGMSVRAMEWGVNSLVASLGLDPDNLLRMAVVGNPTMIHILCGVDPAPIGVSPYQPAFYEARQTSSRDLGFKFKAIPVHTLPQVSGFLGGDILAATLACDMDNQPAGTLLVDMGTNGELMLRGMEGLFGTSCATGPAFEGAALSSGMQAIPGAIDRVRIDPSTGLPTLSVLKKSNGKAVPASGICGSGVISAVAELLRTSIMAPDGRLSQASDTPDRTYVLSPGNPSTGRHHVTITQKDIRAVQLGKAALITGIRFLCQAAGIDQPTRILIAGAFGSHLGKEDMLTLGMLPALDPDRVEMVGNAAGAGAVMAVCDQKSRQKVRELAAQVSVVDLAANMAFQAQFVKSLSFPAL